MNAETLKRWLEGLTLFMGKLATLMFLPWSEGENQEYVPSRSLATNNNSPWQTLLLMSQQSRRNSHSRNSFYPGRPVSSDVFFFNVNIFNFSREFFSSNFIFAPLLPILLGYLQIQSSRTSKASVICTSAYYLALADKFLFPGFASQFKALTTVAGSLAVATLVSLALQLPWWSVFLILLFKGGLFQLLNKLHVTYGNMLRHRPRTMQPLLPLYNVVFNH